MGGWSAPSGGLSSRLSAYPLTRPRFPVRHPRAGHAGPVRDGARALHRGCVRAVRRAVTAHRGLTRRPARARRHGDGWDVVPRCGRGGRDRVAAGDAVPGDGARGAGVRPAGALRRLHDVPGPRLGRHAARFAAGAGHDAAVCGRAGERRRRHRPAIRGRGARFPAARARRAGARAERLGAGDRRAYVRRHHLSRHQADRRDPLRRSRCLGEPAHRSAAGAASLPVRPLRQPAARPAGRRRHRADRPPQHVRRRAPLGAEPERAARRNGHAAHVGRRRPGGLQHRELDGGPRGGRRLLTAARRGARRTASVRSRCDRAHGGRVRGRHGPCVRARSRDRGRQPRAPAPHRRGTLRAGLVVPARLHRPTVNVYFHTFGCKANQYDTELVRQAFAEQGAVVVDDPAAADVAVVNSCTVTAESETKLRRLVRGLARRGAKLETVVMGCAAALVDGRIAGLPSVRAVVGGADPGAVLRAAGMPNRAAGMPNDVGAQHAAPLLGRGVRTRGLLKIQDGCDEHCTFCATTIARGANRSRPVAELVAEARALSEHHAEVVLTGIHIGTYRQDRSQGAADPGPTARGSRQPRQSPALVNPGAPPRGQPTLGELLEALITAVPQVRFRLSSIEATEVDDTIARLLIEAPESLAAHLHAPLQSGSNRVLKRMGRHWYTAESYRARLEWLAERLPVFGLGADVIAGFPGETEADHRATFGLLEALPFTYLHVFPFSVRPDAPAARLSDQLSPATVHGRSRELRQLGEEKARAYRASRVGQTADGVVSGHGAGQIELLTQDYLSVYLPTASRDGRPRCEVTVR